MSSSSSSATVERSLSRVLRGKGIDERIKCTSTLVASYNAEEDGKGRDALRKWLEAYFDEFSQPRTGSIPRKAIAEFVNLAEIKIREPADAELVRRVYTTVRQIVMGEREDCSVYFVLALEHIFSIVDNKILQEDTGCLIALADRLIIMTDPLKVPLTRATFERCASCLHAVERVLMVLHDLEKDTLEQHNLKFFENKAKKHLTKIISCQHYYPFAYQALLVKVNIKKLFEKDIKSLLMNAGRRAFYAFSGGLYIFQVVRELAVMKLDFSAMESGIGNFREALKDIGWDMMPNIQEIVLAASETVELDDFGTFQQCYEKYKKVSWLEGMKWSKQRMTRYALVSHLCLFCTEKHSESIQEPALDLMVKLVTGDEGKQWRNDEQIFEAMIEALIAIGKHNQEYKEKVIHAFNTINSFSSERRKKIIRGCLDGKSFEERIGSEYRLDEDVTNRSLFYLTRQRLNLHRTASVYNRNQQTLKDYYMTDSFAKVSLFSDKTDQRHIETFDFNLEQYEKVVVSQDRVGQSSQDRVGQSSQDNSKQRENNHQRTTMVRKSINMKDLFKKWGNPAHGFQEVGQRILVIGNPGTGKTSLTKRLCFDWANDAWGTQFTHVYLLPIRRLSETDAENDVELPAIIRHILYKTSGAQDNNNILYNEVKDNLSEATTLLILDGYDEGGEIEMELVSLALTLGCCLLVSSRPHSVQYIRPRVHIEVECLEFSDKNLESFVRKELSPENGDHLLEFLDENSSIKDNCRVAVNAQIITRLWRQGSYRAILTKANCANVTGLYSMMANYIWKRFKEKSNEKFNRDLIYCSLERIAFESFRSDLVEIPEDLVLEHASQSDKVFRDAGFLLFMEEGNVFQFAHLTFHEYFAGRYLAKMLKSTSGEERRKAERFISEHKYIETSRVMLSLMTQHYCMRDDMEESLQAFKNLMQILDKDPLPTISLQHLFLRMRTLDAFLACRLDEEEVHTNDVVMQIVKDAMDALKRWFGYEMGEEKGDRVLCCDSNLRTPIIDELARMPNLFNRFPNLLKPILLNESGKKRYSNDYRRDVAKSGRLNPHHVLQCILTMLEDATDEEQAGIIELCAFIGPVCAEPTMDHLKRMCTDQDPKTREMATQPLVAYIDLFPEREDVRQLMVDVSRDPKWDVRVSLMQSIKEAIFAQETKAGTIVWDLLIAATQDNMGIVRESALGSCVRHYQTFAKSIDEVMELVREFVFSPGLEDREYATYVISDLIQKAPEKSEELLVLVKALCRDSRSGTRDNAVDSFRDVAQSSCLTREDLFNVALDLFMDGYPNVQLELLPFLFSFDKENCGIDEVNEGIATCQDLNAEVRVKAASCSAANVLLSNYTIEEIHDGFYDQDKEVQMEIVRQLDIREVESSKGADAIAEMAVHCMQYDEWFGTSKSLLEKLSKTELLPNIALERLAMGLRQDVQCVKQQPLSHLFDCYWSTKNPYMIRIIAKKLLFSSVIFERKGETDMAITLREKGANMKQIVSVEVVQDLLSFCKDCLKEEYGVEFS